MLAVSLMRRNQKATYWYPTGGGSWGEPAWSDPVHLRVRWQDTQQLIRDKEGRETVASAVVYTTQAIDLGGRLLPGTHTGNPPSSSLEPKTSTQQVTVSGEIDHWKVFL